MRRLIGLVLLIAAALFANFLIPPPSAVRADSSGALVVTTCGTLPLAYSVGSTRQLTVNTNGLVCQ